MAKTHRAGSLIVAVCATVAIRGQQAPPSPEKPWAVSLGPGIDAQQIFKARPALEDGHIYTLTELVDIAERSNPATRAAWERAKESAAAAGIARSALYPLLSAVASGSMNQYSQFFGKYYHEDTSLFPAVLKLSYTAFDFGARRAAIDEAQANLIAADFSFNDTHRQIVFHVADAYYRLLDAMAQEGAAQATLTDAQTVQNAVEARLANGLATLPDVLEARAASAQARYELTSIQGLEAIARGALATVLGASPRSEFRIADVPADAISSALEEPVEAVMDRAIRQRPDLQAQLAQIRTADAGIKRTRSAYYPEIDFAGSWGHANGFGEQKNFGSSAQSTIYPYQAQVQITWNVFDGGARKNGVLHAESAKGEAQAAAVSRRDQIEDEVWTACANLKTAREQQTSAAALLEAAQQSYAAATEAFQAGVRTFIDVTTAQRTLARARTAEATARVQLLSSLADVAFRAGDPIPATQH